MTSLRQVSGPARPPFLVLTPACVLLGLATAHWTGADINCFHFFLALSGALAAHVSVNAFNEYFDFRSGLDLRTQRTPYSGGSGTLPHAPALQSYTLFLAVGTALFTTIAGGYFLIIQGWALLPLGLTGLVMIVVYTKTITRNPWLCLVAPGAGFGWFMVMGTHLVLTGSYSWVAFIASTVPFFLVSNLLLLNQFPDVAADRDAGRRHFPIVIGRRDSAIIYAAFNTLAYLSIILGVALGVLPAWSLLGLSTMALAVPATITARRHADEIPKLLPAMTMNVAINILTPVLMSIGLFIA
ncbi:prenyltransferase [bacterium]|nr:prenyltransferase [candidate division CSSED10-310 bacterium]